jgi:uncharacterized membrane protein YfhO
VGIIRADAQQLDLKATGPGLLVVTDALYPGWRVRVDGEESEILPADYAFRGVPLGPGEHLVAMYYEPVSYRLGLFIGLLCCGLLVAALTLHVSARRCGAAKPPLGRTDGREAVLF